MLNYSKLAFLFLISNSYFLYAEIHLKPLEKIKVDDKEYVVTPESYHKEIRPKEKLKGPNAVIHYYRAKEHYHLNEKDEELISDFLIGETDESDYKKLSNLKQKISEHHKLMDELDRASEISGARWPILSETWPIREDFALLSTPLVNLGFMMDFSGIHSFLAFYSLQEQDTYLALEHLKKLEQLSEHMKQDSTFIINGLVYCTIKHSFFEHCLKAIQKSLHDLSFIDKIVDLVNKNPCNVTDFMLFMKGEKYASLTTFDELIQKPNALLEYSTMLGMDSLPLPNSLWEVNMIRDFMFSIIPEKSMKENILKYYSSILEFDMTKSVKDHISKMKHESKSIPKWDLYSQLVLPAMDGAFNSFAQLYQKQRLFYLAREVLHYQQERAIWPEGLEDLQLNQDESFDIFSGNILKYKKDPSPVIYSLGKNMKDDRASSEKDISFYLYEQAIPKEKETK